MDERVQKNYEINQTSTINKIYNNGPDSKDAKLSHKKTDKIIHEKGNLLEIV